MKVNTDFTVKITLTSDEAEALFHELHDAEKSNDGASMELILELRKKLATTR